MSKSIDFLRQLGERLQTQDNAYTASPNYCIQEYVQVTGIDMDFAPNKGWFNSGDEYQQADDKKAKVLDRYYSRYDKEPEGWTKLGYEWKWKYIGVSFLTRDAAHAFVDNQKHNYRDGLRVYVDSHYRNREMREVRRLLAGPVVECIEALQEARRLIELAVLFEGDVTRRIDSALAALDTAKEPHQ